jgi:hypothetical protein
MSKLLQTFLKFHGGIVWALLRIESLTLGLSVK